MFFALTLLALGNLALGFGIAFTLGVRHRQLVGSPPETVENAVAEPVE